MDKTVLNSLLTYLVNTLSDDEKHWIATQLIITIDKTKKETIKPYTKEEIRTMIEESEQQFINGEYVTAEEFLEEWNKNISENIETIEREVV